MGDRGAHLTLTKQQILNIACVTTDRQDAYITLAIRVQLAHKRKLILGAHRLKAFLVFNIAD